MDYRGALSHQSSGVKAPPSVERTRARLFRIAIFVCVVSPVVDMAIWLIVHVWLGHDYTPALGYVRSWLRSLLFGATDENDSWQPMRLALAWLKEHPYGDVYAKLFFADHVKFQYPPSSLLPLYFLDSFGTSPTDVTLNRIGSFVVAANVIASGAFALLLAKRSSVLFDLRYACAILAAVATLSYSPLLKAFSLGQLQVWINALFMMSVLAWVVEKQLLAGLLIGLICLLKPQLALFVLWGVLRRHWRFCSGWLAAFGLGTAVSLAVFGLRNHLDYGSVMHALSRTGEMYIKNQSINGFLNRLYVPSDVASDWQAHEFPPYHALVYYGTLLTSVGLVGAALFVPLKGGSHRDVFDFLLAALTFTVASPIAWEHHYGVMPAAYIALAFWLLTRSTSRWSWPAAATLAASYLITDHWLGGSWMLGGVIATLWLLYWANLETRLPVTGHGSM